MVKEDINLAMAPCIPQALAASYMYVDVLFGLDFSARTVIHLPDGCPASRAPATIRRSGI